MTPAPAVLVSTYELGHQPLGLAAPAAALREAGHAVECIDLAVEPFEAARFRDASLIAISTPMHTAARLGVQFARRVRAVNPRAHICFYGLYASLLDEQLRAGRIADSTIGGEYEIVLSALAGEIAAGGDAAGARARALPRGTGAQPLFERQRYAVPDRSGLPPLARYAQLQTASGSVPAGYVEASRGCAHHCTHCPLTPTYAGRLRLVQPETVLADIDQLVALGAHHITFGDPDFLNAVPHSRGIVERMHERHPALTFDATVKVEHLLEHAPLLPWLRDRGCLFITSAFESLSDEMLLRLDKGHLAADLSTAVALTRGAGIAIRPTWLPFTPWTSIEDFVAILDFVAQQRLVGAVSPVQYGIRLLLPPGSPLIEAARTDGRLLGFDAERMTYEWRAHDARIDALQAEVAVIAEQSARAHPSDAPAHRSAVFAAVHRAALVALHGSAAPHVDPPPIQPVVPALTDDWFC